LFAVCPELVVFLFNQRLVGDCELCLRELFQRNLRQVREKALCFLQVLHFQSHTECTKVVFHVHVATDVHGQRRFTTGRCCRQNHHAAFRETTRALVVVPEPCFDSRDNFVIQNRIYNCLCSVVRTEVQEKLFLAGC